MSSKVLKCAEPDVIVHVGSGKKQRTYECYKIILAEKCAYFDSMFSCNMIETVSSQVQFPLIEPQQWELFYSIIKEDVELTKTNVLDILPVFDMFNMTDRLEQCDNLLASFKPTWPYDSFDRDSTRQYCICLLDLVGTCGKHHLEKAESKLFALLGPIADNNAYFADTEIIQQMINVSPYSKNTRRYFRFICAPSMEFVFDDTPLTAEKEAVLKNDLLAALLVERIGQRMIKSDILDLPQKFKNNFDYHDGLERERATRRLKIALNESKSLYGILGVHF